MSGKKKGDLDYQESQQYKLEQRLRQIRCDLNKGKVWTKVPVEEKL